MIQLQNLRPDPIFDGGKERASDVWATQCRFEKGKKYLISAPSGKGKSTLLHLIYGLRNDYSGTINIEERGIRDFNPDEWSDLRQRKLSIIFQDLRLFPELSVLENIQLKNKLSDFKSENEIRDMARALGIIDLLAKSCQTLSYGQRQRVAIIRALCQPFEFLLLDEPFSHLDQANIEIASALITKAVNEQQAALLLVSLGDSYGMDYDARLIL